MKYIIAGKKYLFINKDREELTPLLCELLGSYNKTSDDNCDITIEFTKEILSQRVKYKNPKIHTELEYGFAFPSNFGQIAFLKKKSKPKIMIQLNSSFYKNSSFSKFVTNGEFSSLHDKLSSILFEMLIVPSTFFFDDLAIIHSAGVLSQSNEAILVGGTGGIGKTSIEIELCFYGDYRFINDDIGIIDSHGNIYPNYANPKIYGYNLEGYPKLKKTIFRNRSFLDVFAWRYKLKRNGIAKVRRKVSHKIFNSVLDQKMSLSTYFLLSRHDGHEIIISSLSPHDAAIETQNIIETEYSEILKHFRWHSYNRHMEDEDPVIDIVRLSRKKIDLLTSAFSDSRIMKALVPEEIKHDDYLSKMKAIIRSNS